MAGRNYGLNVVLKLVSEQFSNGLNAAKTSLRNFQATSKGFASGISQGFKSMSGLSLGTLGLAGAVAVVGNEFRKSIQYSIAYEKTLSNLKALTGASSADMGYYKQAASELGNQFGKTGQEMAETFKIVGSGKSELLKNKEGLVAVSAAAITLSKAAGMEVPEAADALVIAMNQFNAPATQANRYINALAAGAKEGAAEIPNLSASLTKFGSVANALKIPVEQSIAMIEALSEKGLKDEVAGTGIKTFLLKLEQGAKNTRPSVVGLEQALDNLKKKNLSVNEAQNMFGMEAANVALALISQTERVKQLNKAVTGTDEAYKQASINSDNVAGALTKLSASWTNLKENTLNGKGWLSNILAGAVGLVQSLIYDLDKLGKTTDKQQNDRIKEGLSSTNYSEKAYTAYDSKLKSDSDISNEMNVQKNKGGYTADRLNKKKYNNKDEQFALKAELQAINLNIVALNQLRDARNAPIKASKEKTTNDANNLKKESDAKSKAESDARNKLNKSTKEDYLESVRINKSEFDLSMKTEDEFNDTKLKNLDTYLRALIKNNQDKTKEFEDVYAEWSKLSSDAILDSDIKATVSLVSKVDAKDLLDDEKLDDVELPVPITLLSDKEKFDVQFEKIQDKLHPLELELAFKGTDALLGVMGSIHSLGSAFSDLSAKQAANKDGFWDYVSVVEQSVGAIKGMYDSISTIIAIIGALDTAKTVSTGVTVATSATEMAAETSKNATVIAGLTAVIAATEAVDAAKGISAGIAVAGAATEVTATAVKTSTNIAGATTSVATSAATGGASWMASIFNTMPWFVALPIALAGIGGIMALFSGLMKFEKGGVVPGGSYSGDNIIARVNSGEGIVTRKGISNLGNMMQSNAGATGGNVQFEIKGQSLIGILGKANKFNKTYL